MNTFLSKILSFLFVIGQTYLFSQTDVELDKFKGVNFANENGNGIINSFGKSSFVYPAPGRSIPFWISFGDTNTNEVDTTISIENQLILTKLEGPGEIIGVPEKLTAKFCYFNNLQFTKSGYYKIHLQVSGNYKYEKIISITVLKDSDLCHKAPSGKCGNEKGNKVSAKGHCGNIIPVDAVLPVIVTIIDSTTGNIDSTYKGTIYVSKNYGPGEIYGTLSMSGSKWFNFNNIHFTSDGYYNLKFYDKDSSHYKSTNLDVIVTSPSSIIELNVQNIAAYPNPFIDRINISMPYSKTNLSYTLYDESLRIVAVKDNENVEGTLIIDTHSMPAGFYILSIKSSQGNILKNIPVIKK